MIMQFDYSNLHGKQVTGNWFDLGNMVTEY